MAWAAAVLPYVGAGVSAATSFISGRQNAQALRLQSIAANQQTTADEEATRRQSRSFLARQAAAIAESGVGMDGSAGMLADQSATLAELDALNVRYQGRNRANGLVAESATEGRRAKMLAGAQLLSGVSNAYTRGRVLPGS